MYKLRDIWKTNIITIRVSVLMAVFFIACLAVLPGADAEANVMLVDMKAEHVSGNIALIIDADNMHNSYVKATPVITVYSQNDVVINKALGQYILLPNRTSRITVHYSRSLFSEGNYTIESKLEYDKTESNILLKTLGVSGNKLTMGNAKEIVAPAPEQLNAWGEYGEHLPYFIIMLLSVIIISLSLSWFRRVKTNSDGIPANGDTGTVKESEENTILDDGSEEMQQDMEREIRISETVSDGVEEEKKDEDAYPDKECANVDADSCRVLGKDVIHAICEEKERLKDEIDDLDRLYKKNILDTDIFEKSKKGVEDKLEQVSVESLLTCERCSPELKEDIAGKLKYREGRIVSSIAMLDKLYSDKLIDEDMYEKNKKDLNNALDKIKNINSRM